MEHRNETPKSFTNNQAIEIGETIPSSIEITSDWINELIYKSKYEVSEKSQRLTIILPALLEKSQVEEKSKQERILLSVPIWYGTYKSLRTDLLSLSCSQDVITYYTDHKSYFLDFETKLQSLNFNEQNSKQLLCNLLTFIYEKEKGKKFRIRSSSVMLVGKNICLDKRALLAGLKEFFISRNLKTTSIMIAEEYGNTSLTFEERHFHILVTFAEAFDISQDNFFSFDFAGHSLDFHVTCPKNYQSSLRYLCKTDVEPLFDNVDLDQYLYKKSDQNLPGVKYFLKLNGLKSNADSTHYGYVIYFKSDDQFESMNEGKQKGVVNEGNNFISDFTEQFLPFFIQFITLMFSGAYAKYCARFKVFLVLFGVFIFVFIGICFMFFGSLEVLLSLVEEPVLPVLSEFQMNLFLDINSLKEKEFAKIAKDPIFLKNRDTAKPITSEELECRLLTFLRYTILFIIQGDIIYIKEKCPDVGDSLKGFCHRTQTPFFTQRMSYLERLSVMLEFLKIPGFRNCDDLKTNLLFYKDYLETKSFYERQDLIDNVMFPRLFLNHLRGDEILKNGWFNKFIHESVVDSILKNEQIENDEYRMNSEEPVLSLVFDINLF